jgi:hypothetical protein
MSCFTGAATVLLMMTYGQEKLTSYDYIGAYFASFILEHLGAPVEQAIASKIESKAKKNEEAIIKISEGLAAYDRNDTGTAVQVLNEAKALDPENSIAREYLDKLVLNTSKFKTITEQYYALVNPAYLGIIRFDSFYIASSYNTLFAPDWRDISVYPGFYEQVAIVRFHPVRLVESWYTCFDMPVAIRESDMN